MMPAQSGEQSACYCMQLLALLADIRVACGDNGRRMQDELVQYIAGLHDTLSVIADPRAKLPDACGRCRERVYEDMAQEARMWTANAAIIGERNESE